MLNLRQKDFDSFNINFFHESVFRDFCCFTCKEAIFCVINMAYQNKQMRITKLVLCALGHRVVLDFFECDKLYYCIIILTINLNHFVAFINFLGFAFFWNYRLDNKHSSILIHTWRVDIPRCKNSSSVLNCCNLSMLSCLCLQRTYPQWMRFLFSL